MLNSAVIKVPIQIPYEKAYAFLSDPKNYRVLSPIPDVVVEDISEDGRTFTVELPRGKRRLRYSPVNPFGVLDYAVFDMAGNPEGPTVGLRLIPNEDGCELLMVFFQRPGVDDAKFASDLEWTTNDLKSFRALLEAL